MRESAVVGVTHGAEERVHAVLVLEPAADKDAIVRAANSRLQDHQRIRAASVWTTGDLPRTEGHAQAETRARFATGCDRARTPVRAGIGRHARSRSSRASRTAAT